MKRFIITLFLTALVLRLIPVIATHNTGIGLDDMFQYDMLARSILSGEGYRWYSQPDLDLMSRYVTFDLTNYDPRGVITAFRPPAYPFFLSIIYFFGGTGDGRFFIVRLVQAILGALLPLLTWAIARRAFPAREKAARIAGWVVALYPMLCVYPLALATENLIFLLVLIALLLTLVAAEKQHWLWYLLAGITFGAACLTRSVVLLGCLAACVWLWIALKQRKGAVIVLAAMFAVITPWVIRNSIVFHHFTWIEESLGYQLYISYHPENEGGFSVDVSYDLIPYLDDVERNEAGMAAFRQFVAADPGRIPYLMLRRAGYFFGLEKRALTYFYVNNFFGYIPSLPMALIAGVLLLPFMVVSLSAALGAVIPWNRGMWLLMLFAFFYFAPHLMIISEERFHMALVPILAMLAAQAWTRRDEVKALWPTRAGRLSLAAAGLAMVLLIGNWGFEVISQHELLAAIFSPGGNTLYLPY